MLLREAWQFARSLERATTSIPPAASQFSAQRAPRLRSAFGRPRFPPLLAACYEVRSPTQRYPSVLDLSAARWECSPAQPVRRVSEGSRDRSRVLRADQVPCPSSPQDRP